MKKIFIITAIFGALTLAGFGCTKINEQGTPAPITAKPVTEIKYYISPNGADNKLKYCNGADMDSAGYKKTLTKEVTTTVEGTLTGSELAMKTIQLAAEAEGLNSNNIADQTDFIKIVGDTAYIKPAEGWAGVSIFLCAWTPFVEKQLEQFTEIKKVIWASNQAEFKNADSLYTCLHSPYVESFNFLPPEIASSTMRGAEQINFGDPYKIADYIVRNNLYAVACGKFWHGNNVLLTKADLTEGAAEHLDITDWFQYSTGDKLYVFYGHGPFMYEADRYIVVDLDKGTTNIVHDDKIHLFAPLSPNKKLMFVSTGGSSYGIYDWMNKRIIKEISLETNETVYVDTCLEEEGEGLSDYVTWLSDDEIEIKSRIVDKTQRWTDANGWCKPGRTFTVKI